MAKLTKKQFEEVFREEILPYVIKGERVGFPDKPGRRTAWNDMVDSYIRDGRLPEAAGNWGHPRWLETWSPKRADADAYADENDYATKRRSPKKSPAQLDREINEALAPTRPINKRKRVRHFSESRGKTGGTHYFVTYEDLTGHGITRAELDRYRQHEQGRSAHATKADRPLFDQIVVNDRVTIVDRFGKQHTGRAVMRGPHGWVLNMGGRHGTPGIASHDNTVKVVCGKKK